MTLKKRLFLSNMRILCLSLFSLLAVIILVMVIFEDTLEKKFFTMDQSEIDANITDVQKIIEDTDLSSFSNDAEKVRDLGYEICLFQNGEIVQGDSDENMMEIVNGIDQDALKITSVSLYYYRNATCLIKYDPKTDMYLAAAHFSQDTLKSSIKDTMWLWILMIALIGAGVISVLLLLSSIFTKKMTQIVMEPMDELALAATRITEGNLNEPIVYEGESEFEQVIRVFNNMQERIVKNEKARNDMITSISHDLRTPLTSIQGYIKGILDGVANTEEKKKQYLLTAYDATKEMNVLLQKLFNFSKLESGDFPFHFLKVDMVEFVQHWIIQHQEEAIIDFTYEEGVSDVSLDIDEFQRILENLLENSRKYANADPLKITVSVFQKGQNAELVWKDNGEGVEESKIEHIFERFYRCDEARQRNGSGIGLYVVRYITEAHGGTVKAENEDGLKFTFSFPAVR